jgi:hypothetical protein
VLRMLNALLRILVTIAPTFLFVRISLTLRAVIRCLLKKYHSNFMTYLSELHHKGFSFYYKASLVENTVMKLTCVRGLHDRI